MTPINNLLKPLIWIGLIIIPFLGMYHEANAIVIPIVIPFGGNNNHPTTCTQVNSTIIHCVPDPPSIEEQQSMWILIGGFLTAMTTMIVIILVVLR